MLPNCHDLTKEEIAALPLWQRCAFFIQPFNSSALRFNRDEWARWVSHLRGEDKDEWLRELDRVIAFVETERGRKDAA